MVGRALQIAAPETNGGQAVMNVRGVRFQRQGLQIELPSLLVIPLGNGLAGLLAQTFDGFIDHELRPRLATVGGTSADPRLFLPSRRLYTAFPMRHNRKSRDSI